MGLGLADSLSVAGLVASWLGTLFTGVGLVAVVAQLRSLLQAASFDRERRLRAVAGAWAPCILIKLSPSTQGLVEGSAPSFSGWLQRYYIEDRFIRTTQDDNGDEGNSTWTKLFSRLSIQADSLIAFGGHERADFPLARKLRAKNIRVRTLRTDLTDLMLENETVSWGYTPPEFAAIIILAGFPPRDFAHAETSKIRSVSSFGSLVVAAFGPFTNVAKFDSHGSFYETKFEYQNGFNDSSRQVDVPVGHCLQLAYGMIRTPDRTGRRWIILPDLGEETSANPWQSYPSVKQLKNLQSVCEKLAGVTELPVAEYAYEQPEHLAKDIDTLQTLLGNPPQDKPVDLQHIATEILSVAHAIALIRPWGARAVLPVYFVNAFRGLLEPFYKPRPETIGVMQAEFGKMPPDHVPAPGKKSCLEHQTYLSHVGGSKEYFFDTASSCCTFYFDAMKASFGMSNITVEDVRVALAARVAARRLKELGLESSRFETNMRLELGDLRPKPLPQWTIDVYASFLWGWLTDSIEADLDLMAKFPRRTFLG